MKQWLSVIYNGIQVKPCLETLHIISASAFILNKHLHFHLFHMEKNICFMSCYSMFVCWWTKSSLNSILHPFPTAILTALTILFFVSFFFFFLLNITFLQLLCHLVRGCVYICGREKQVAALLYADWEPLSVSISGKAYLVVRTGKSREGCSSYPGLWYKMWYFWQPTYKLSWSHWQLYAPICLVPMDKALCKLEIRCRSIWHMIKPSLFPVWANPCLQHHKMQSQTFSFTYSHIPEEFYTVTSVFLGLLNYGNSFDNHSI